MVEWLAVGDAHERVRDRLEELESIRNQDRRAPVHESIAGVEARGAVGDRDMEPGIVHRPQADGRRAAVTQATFR